MSPAPADTPLVAVVAAFEPDQSVVDRIARLTEQVDRVVVVDDGSSDDARGVLADLAAVRRVQVIRSETNRGIAAALNAGTRAALELGARVVMTLDQDSSPAPGYAAAARGELARLRAAGRPLAMVAAGVQSGRPVRPVRYRDHGDRLTPTLEAIQSGLVLPADVFKVVGGFDESLFIDCVDTDFVLRAAAGGVPTYLARNCAIDHPLGRLIKTERIRTTRSGRRDFAFHPAWRRYYISRNRAVVFARYATYRPDWVVVALLGETVQLMRSVAFGTRRLEQVSAVALGIVDALRGRRGRLGGGAARLLGAP